MSVKIPHEYTRLLESKAVAFIATIGPNGEPHTTPIWFLWEGGSFRFSLVDGRQKLRNLRRDPRLSVTVVDPADDRWYVELRGRIDGLLPDPDLTLERRVAEKYAGHHVDVEAPGTQRYATRVIVERVTGQRGHIDPADACRPAGSVTTFELRRP